MKTFIMTSPVFEGEVKFEYDDDTGLLRGLEIPVDMGAVGHNFLLNNLPATLVQMRAFPAWLKKMNSQATVTELVREVSFEEFWKRYFAGRGSDNSSKKKSGIRWNRMSKGEQLRAYNYIPRYLNRIPAGVGVKLAETYLNSGIWSN